MTNEQENFAIQLTNDCKTHEQWLAVVRFGLKTLLEDQTLLFEIIVREANRMHGRAGIAGRVVSDDARIIFDELGLRFYVQRAKGGASGEDS